MFTLPVKPRSVCENWKNRTHRESSIRKRRQISLSRLGRYFIELSRSWPRSRRLPGCEGRVQLIERGHVETAVSARSQISLDSAKSIRRIPRDIEGPYWRVAVSRTFMKFSSTLRFPDRISKQRLIPLCSYTRIFLESMHSEVSEIRLRRFSIQTGREDQDFCEPR